ncbi:SPW repeat domain-containing protein [Microvirga yunnanensis]|uniref:SPW repeat domain-containing protein n=1 Tax=Microvirga yunnanensis TaxID=2953740 RepID=UPI0021C8DC26|nr:hypothetical protein [Microvirga sp. HBU65207]
MPFIPTRIHAAIDCPTGLALTMAPFLLGFADNGPAQWVPMILGAAILVTSPMTDDELSLGRLIPMRAHLGVDAAGGLLLAASPGSSALPIRCPGPVSSSACSRSPSPSRRSPSPERRKSA